MATYNVLIIGAGQIGAFFDKPGSTAVLTHAHAFHDHPGFHLVGFVDVDKENVNRAAELWNEKAFRTVEEAFDRNAIDVAVVAVPDEHHFTVLKELALFPIHFVFAEKPLTKTVTESEHIVRHYQEKGILLAVNYTRRFVPEFAVLRSEIAAGKYGQFLAGSGFYGKGTLHNGSHLIDLVRSLLGEIVKTRTISCIHDHFDDDPSCSAILILEGEKTVYMGAVDSRHYAVFELDLLFERQRIRIIDSGSTVQYYETRPSDLFVGYRNLSLTRTSETGLNKALSFASDSIYGQLSAGVPCPSSGDNGLVVQRICAEILQALA